MEKYFKKSFRGYKTDDVDNFIVELNDVYDRKEQEYAEKIRVLESEIKKLRSDINGLNEEAIANAASHNAEMAEQQTKYDLLCAEVGEKMVMADKRASDIIKNAEREANIIIESAKTNARNEAKIIISDAEKQAEKIITETEKSCNELTLASKELCEKQAMISRSMSETEKSINDAINKLRGNVNTIGE